ncbi:MAG: DUF234 domain-containing protein [Chloroflexales bacterium]|nr:DUF234 domain-containing protein [Chloroflexales bacterium]
MPERIGSHWSRNVQADVVAVHWNERTILIGKCKWGADTVDKATVRALIERTIPLVLADLPDKGVGWQVIPAIFARAGGTPAARTELTTRDGVLVDVTQLWGDLAS